MPGFDGTGPRGLGPMTGGGRGFCAVPAGGRAISRGRRGAFYGYGMAYGAPYWAPPSTEMTPEGELAMLRSEADALKKELESIESRIQGLEKKE